MSRISGRCATCGLPGHRYGSTDTEHDPNPVGCVNQLRAVLEEALRLLSVPLAEADTAYGAECDVFLSRVLPMSHGGDL